VSTGGPTGSRSAATGRSTAHWSLSILAGWAAGFEAHATDPDGDAVTLSGAFALARAGKLVGKASFSVRPDQTAYVRVSRLTAKLLRRRLGAGRGHRRRRRRRPGNRYADAEAAHALASRLPQASSGGICGLVAGFAAFGHLEYFLPNDIYILENLESLGGLPPVVFFAALPLKIANGTGSPLRPVAFVPKR
jgi:hypothetical protein